MQTPSAVRTRSKAASMPARELSWSFMLLIIVCACVVAAGFFFAARQHFTSMDYGIKNSQLREQLQNLETEKRRLLLAREVALSPLAIRKAATQIGMRENADMAAVKIQNKQPIDKRPTPETGTVEAVASTSTPARAVIKTVLTTPVQPKSTGDVRGRIVEPSKEKKDKTEVAALLKLR